MEGGIKSVKDFYTTFDFEKVITDAPVLIQNFLDEEIAFIKRLPLTGKQILEVGCGYGRLLTILGESAGQVVGIDFSQPLVAKARHRVPSKNVQILEQNASKMSFGNDVFDYVMCLDATFGNMPGIENEVLLEMKRVCKKGGEIILSVFSEAAKNAQHANYERIGLTDIRDDGKAVTTKEGLYSRRFSKDDLMKLGSSAGLTFSIRSLCTINYVAIAIK